MRAITVKRIYANRIAYGQKRYEVRNFKTDYRGPVVVTVSGEKLAICVVDLVGIVPSANAPGLAAEERAYGRWAWQLANPRMIKPIPVRGKLGLWRWPGQPIKFLFVLEKR